MSQYPDPSRVADYGHWAYGGSPQHSILAPARRGGVMTIILGSLGVLGGLCVGGMAFMLNNDAFRQEMMQQPNLPAEFAGMADVLGVIVGIAAVVVLIVSITLIVLGIYTYRGSMGSAIAALVLAGLGLLYGILNTLLLLAQAGANPQMALGLGCSLLLPVLTGLTVAFLIGAIQACSKARGLRGAQPGQPGPGEQSPPYGQQPYPYPGFPPHMPPPPPPGQGPVGRPPYQT